MTGLYDSLILRLKCKVSTKKMDFYQFCQLLGYPKNVLFGMEFTLSLKRSFISWLAIFDPAVSKALPISSQYSLLSPCATGVNFLMLIFLISNFELCFTSNLDFFSLFSSEWLFLSSKQVSWVNWWAKAILFVWRLMASWCSRFSYWAVKPVWRS